MGIYLETGENNKKRKKTYAKIVTNKVRRVKWLEKREKYE